MKCRGRVDTTPDLYADNIKKDLKNIERQDVGRRPTIFDYDFVLLLSPPKHRFRLGLLFLSIVCM